MKGLVRGLRRVKKVTLCGDGGVGAAGGGSEDGKSEGMGGGGGGGLPLWKMYWSSWKNRPKKREEQEKFRGEGNRSFGLWMNPWGTLLGGVIPSSGLSLADSARAEELSMAEGACS